MRRSRDERPEYVVELLVEAVAVLTVRAQSAAEAGELAEERVRPVDVTEIHETTGVTVAEVSRPGKESDRAASSASPETASKGPERGRQT